MAPLPVPHDLSSSTCSCRAYVHGAHVVDWTPTGSEPVLWLSPRARLESSAAIRGGVPIIFPWFGSGRTGGMTPSHGFGRLSDWRLASLECASDRATAEFALDSNHVTSAEFPSSIRGPLFRVRGRAPHARADGPQHGRGTLHVRRRLHTYLAVGDVTEVTVLGLDGAEYVDQAAGPSTRSRFRRDRSGSSRRLIASTGQRARSAWSTRCSDGCSSSESWDRAARSCGIRAEHERPNRRLLTSDRSTGVSSFASRQATSPTARYSSLRATRAPSTMS